MRLLALILTLLAAVPVGKPERDVLPEPRTEGPSGAQEDPPLPPAWVPIHEFQGEAVDTIRETFPDGPLRRVACYLAGRRDAAAQHGPEWTWWPNGAVQGQRVLVHGKQEGPSASYYESGLTESVGGFLADGRHGQWSFYNEKGILKALRSFDHGEPHGRFLILFADGGEKLEQEFDHGQQVGVEREWTLDGELLREAHFRAGKLHGPLERIEFTGKRPPEEVGDLQGTEALLRVRHLENYEDGLKSGAWKLWDENGTQVLEENYAKDKLHGVTTRWRADGTLASRVTYTEGRMEGDLNAWYDNDQLQMQGRMVDGKREGTWRYWRRDGSLIEAWCGEYAADQRISD